MSDYFLLDPDYKDFDFLDKQNLKFLIVYGEQHTFIVLAIVLPVILCSFLYFIIFGLFLPELGYVVLGASAQATVITACQATNYSYTYAFDIIDMQGREHHNLGTVSLSRSDSCPQLGSSITVDYIQGQSKISRPSQGLEISWLKISLAVLMAWYAYSWIREVPRTIKAYTAARPKLDRLKGASAVILDGTLVRANQAPKVKFGRRREGYYIEVEYDFVVYDHFFRGKQVKRRNDLFQKPLPPPGTPVRVLYADENTYVML